MYCAAAGAAWLFVWHRLRDATAERGDTREEA
jgi:hypothetical protein